MVYGQWDEPRDVQAGVAKALAREELVARDGGRAWRMPRQTELFGDARGDHRRPVADDDDPVDRSSLRRLENRGGRCILVVKPNRNRAVLPGILDQVTPIRREDKLHPKPLGGLTKRARLVAGSGR